jgi:GTP-binding protein
MKRERPPSRPVVAIIGRPNVGKSTLFNRLVGRRQAIVDDQPGVTRDRNYGSAEWEGRPFDVVDTGGFDAFSEDRMSGHIRRQADRAVEEAAAVLFVVDIMEGLTAKDEELFRLLRSRYRGRLLVLANKADNMEREAEAAEFYRLGVDHVFPVSAVHGIGIDEVLDEVAAVLPPAAETEGGVQPLRVAIVGRPNVGKSSLVNAILGDERVVVDNTPGTTRDAVDTPFVRRGKPWLLIDTAGIRRRGKIDRTLERYSVIRAVKSMERADVCVLVLDAEEVMTDQDAHIGGAVADAARACVIVVNKWDLVDLGPKAGDIYREKVADGLKHLSWAPVVFTSALTGRGIEKLLDAVEMAYGEYSRTVTTPRLNEFLQNALRAYKPPTFKGKSLYVGYITQESARPPAFTVIVNDPGRVHFSYRRYLENRLREEFGFGGSSVVLRFRRKAGKKRAQKEGEI